MKVLILYNQLFHYRIPIFRLLAEHVELTVAYSIGNDTDEMLNFSVIRLPIYKFGRFVYHKYNITKLCSQYDVIIAYGDIAWLKFSTLPFQKKRKYKIIFWSPGVSASYTKKFDAINKWDSVRDFFYKRADALIFYSNYPINKYISRGFNKEKLFVAPNTVEIYNKLNHLFSAKDSLLFIGTLYMQKGIFSLLESYKLAYHTNSEILPLNLVGGGADLNIVNEWVVNNNLTKMVVIHGPIYNSVEKSKYFEKAFACISPSQAGLAVLESFGYGVPFITMHDSITGGERLNIIHQYNGILLQDLSELTNTILDISNNREKYFKMGTNALDYYNKKARPIHMVNGLKMSIEYVTK